MSRWNTSARIGIFADNVPPMALDNSIVRMLAVLKERRMLEGVVDVVEIGAQQLSDSFLKDQAELDRLFSLFAKAKPYLGNVSSAGTIDGVERLSEVAPSSELFWQSLGFNYSAIEFDGHRESIAIDLNRDVVPFPLRGTFDLVVNTGTTEHVANQDNAFRIIHDLTDVGGIMIHVLPAGGMMNHGLINYNAKFFWHLCRENNYGVVSLTVADAGANPVPSDIVSSNKELGDGWHGLKGGEVPDFMIYATLRKTSPLPFVTPLDIPVEIIPRQRFDLALTVRRLLWRMSPVRFSARLVRRIMNAR